MPPRKRIFQAAAARLTPSGHMKRFASGHVLWLLPTLLALCSLAAVGPKTPFPLNDDWVYAKPVFEFLETGVYKQHPFAATNAVALQAWGVVCAAIFGSSWTALHLSVMFLSILAAWICGLCAREIGLDKFTAAVCGATLFANPIAHYLSYMFMTDIPFLVPMLLSMLFFLRYFHTGLERYILYGAFWAALAFFIRQFAVVLPVAFVMTYVFRAIKERRWPSAKAFALLVTPWVLAVIFHFVYKNISPGEYDWKTFPAKGSLAWRSWLIVEHVGVSLLYLGLFSLPLALPRLYRLLRGQERWRWGRWTLFVLSLVFIQATACKLWQTHLPILPNVLRDLGLGPLTLRDVYMSNYFWSPVRVGGAVWWPITELAVISGAVLLAATLPQLIALIWRWRHAEGFSQHPSAYTPLFLALLIAGFIAAPYNVYLPSIIDRYLLPTLVPGVLLVAVTLASGVQRTMAVALCTIFFLFSVAGVQDSLSWNRARWKGIAGLKQELGVNPYGIDGGFEYNGAYTSDAYMEKVGSRSFWETYPYQWLLSYEYAISFLKRKDTVELGRIPYFSYLGMTTRRLLILKTLPPTADEASSAESGDSSASSTTQ